MRIVHTEASCGWGGQEIRILNETQGMIARGHMLFLLCPPHSRIFEEAQKRGLHVEALPIGRKKLRGLFALRRWLKNNPVDVVNTHSSTDSWLTALACTLLPHPPAIVRTRHISAPVNDGLGTRWLYTRATRHIVTTGEKLREQLIVDNGYPGERITSVPTGIDTRHFHPQDKMQARLALGLPPEKKLIGIVATLRSWKGHRYLVDAIANLNDASVNLVIVGDGPQREALMTQIARLGLADQVLMAGNQSDVAPWLQALDIFVLPSYANEGVPQALLQAMLCGLPCITTDAGAIPEIAVHEHTAYVIARENSIAIRDAITHLLAEPALMARLGAAAHNRAQLNFSLETMLNKMEPIFTHAATGNCKA